MSILTDHLENAQTALRELLEQSKAAGEKAASLLKLNGARDMLPNGVVSAIETVRQAYEKANEMAANVLAEQLKMSRPKVESKPKPTPLPEDDL